MCPDGPCAPGSLDDPLVPAGLARAGLYEQGRTDASAVRSAHRRSAERVPNPAALRVLFLPFVFFFPLAKSQLIFTYSFRYHQFVECRLLLHVGVEPVLQTAEGLLTTHRRWLNGQHLCRHRRQEWELFLPNDLENIIQSDHIWQTVVRIFVN